MQLPNPWKNFNPVEELFDGIILHIAGGKIRMTAHKRNKLYCVTVLH